jgi:hypothetical protein
MSNLRFTYSPLIELTISFSNLKTEFQRQLYGRWMTEASRAIYDVQFPLLNELILSWQEHQNRHRPNKFQIGKFGRYIPDFLTATPLWPTKNIENEFVRIREMPQELIREQISIMVSVFGATDTLCQFMAYPSHYIDCLINEMREYWNRTLKDDWSRIQSTLESDILYNSRMLTLLGYEKLFPELDKKFTFEANTIFLQDTIDNYIDNFVLTGQHLYLTPSIFSGNLVWHQLGEAWDPMFIYTPRGIGLWNNVKPDSGEGLEIILGVGKANLLKVLSTPLSVGEIAHRLEITAGAVSQHVVTLHKADLIVANRHGKRVFYRLTERGQQLISLFS